MMDILHMPAQVGPCVLVLGMFDGVHRGHQALLMQGAEQAEQLKLPLVVATFEPHPLDVLFPERAPKRLTTLEERASLMEGYGVDKLCVTKFTREIADTPPEVFLSELSRTFAPKCVICGFNYTFGAKGAGKPEDLDAYGQAHGFTTIVLPPVEIAGGTVSSTRIREELEKGDIRLATRLLGHAYTFSGTVEQGKHIGRELGFPTANVSYTPEKAFPRYGVYVGYLMTESGKARQSVINIGRHPTLPEGNITIEVHVLGEHPDLYGRAVTVMLMDFLRDEQKFESREALVEQLERDRDNASGWFAAHR
ncbi:MAG: bifunctional riboflavin kinase/FAD synthetase [Clostridia bacterium]|nr:bifunctional riboflavin kinase/FAD synthetase [Clostridia bacterium]